MLKFSTWTHSDQTQNSFAINAYSMNKTKSFRNNNNNNNKNHSKIVQHVLVFLAEVYKFQLRYEQSNFLFPGHIWNKYGK